MRSTKLEPITEAVVKTAAQIIGPHGAAAQALADAERRRAAGQQVTFFKAGASIVVRGTLPAN